MDVGIDWPMGINNGRFKCKTDIRMAKVRIDTFSFNLNLKKRKKRSMNIIKYSMHVTFNFQLWQTNQSSQKPRQNQTIDFAFAQISQFTIDIQTISELFSNWNTRKKTFSIKYLAFIHLNKCICLKIMCPKTNIDWEKWQFVSKFQTNKWQQLAKTFLISKQYCFAFKLVFKEVLSGIFIQKTHTEQNTPTHTHTHSSCRSKQIWFKTVFCRF